MARNARVMPPVISGSKASASDLPTGACLPTSGGTIDTSVDAVVVGALPAVAVKVKQPARPENAKDDLSRLADMFGADLRDVSMPTSGGSIPSDWLDYSSCVDVLHENGICPAHIDALEVYAGCGGWTKACHSCGLKVGPLIDNKYGKGRWDSLSAKWWC